MKFFQRKINQIFENLEEYSMILKIQYNTKTKKKNIQIQLCMFYVLNYQF